MLSYSVSSHAHLMTAPTLPLQLSSLTSDFTMSYDISWNKQMMQATSRVPLDLHNKMIQKYVKYHVTSVLWGHVTMSSKGTSNPYNY